jgi:DNA-binding MarR family transcriptional regulator
VAEQDDPDLDFGMLLGFAWAEFVAELHEALAEQGFDDLGTSFGYVFRVLLREERSVKELADLLDITPPGAVKLVDEMEAKGYVRRVADSGDRRVRRLQLTDRGRAAVVAARAFHGRFEAQLAAATSERTARDARRALQAIADRREPSTGRRLRPM